MSRRRMMVHDQQGSALAMALVFLLLISILIAVVTVSTIGTIDRTKRKSAQSTGLATADRAIVVYQYALQAKMATEGTLYAVTGADLEQASIKAGSAVSTGSSTGLSGAASSSGPIMTSQVIHNSQFATRPIYKEFKEQGLHQALNKSLAKLSFAERSWYQYTVRERIADDQFGYWQLMEVIQPSFEDGDSSKVVAYLRAWTANAHGHITTEPRIIRAEFRPGRFADYQMIADGPIEISVGGVEISGPIHTNGYRDRYMADDSSGIHIRQEASSTKCVKGKALFSTTRGPINVGASKSCGSSTIEKRENTNIEISFLRVEDSFEFLRENCNTKRVVCPMPNAGFYDVKLGTRMVQVNGVNFGAFYANQPDVRAFYFRGNVRVSGEYRGGDEGGRITLAAERYDQGGTSYSKPAEIELNGGKSGEVGAYSTRDIVGLMAQGNVVLGGFKPWYEPHGKTYCPRKIRAAIIAESGALSIPEQWLTATLPPVAASASPVCSDVSVNGSVAGHFAPAFVTQWRNLTTKELVPEKVGYTGKRLMKYNYRLFRNPPPYFPLTGPWQVVDFSDANHECLRAAKLDATCR